MKVFRDPVHNLISFDKTNEKLFLDLIDTKEFQRLRHIRQLGVSSYTYPGAEHTRLAHSIGVAHLTKRFVERLGQFKGEITQEILEYKDVAIAAALLHDIGHSPFSHALEDVTNVNHEKWTVHIITDPSTEIYAALERYKPDFSKQVADVIQRTHHSSVLVKLLSSQLDTDRIDYLQRDSLMTGAQYGSFDLEWLINTLRIGEVQGTTEVGLDLNKGLSIAEVWHVTICTSMSTFIRPLDVLNV
ncbi:HD domain-containing protein [Salicibibacter kimchii]|uniref:HD domain-containing protein n=1 Tax=Salicibibacter kimchii TaxID=2099786 RepID=UPI001D05AD72|nr:HD domain-containing protein [Salicibibacter kimchii]